MLQNIKEETLEWIDAQGVNTSEDLLKVSIVWALLSVVTSVFEFIPTISQLTFYRVTCFLLLFAYILYAAAKPKVI